MLLSTSYFKCGFVIVLFTCIFIIGISTVLLKNEKHFFQSQAFTSRLTNKDEVGSFSRFTTADQEGSVRGYSPLLTLFTTIKDRKSRKEIHQRLLNNWASLTLDVFPVLFVPYNDNNTEWRKQAHTKGWNTSTLQPHHLRENVPIVRSMYQEIQRNITSSFMGFANADILFDDSLVQTLKFISKEIPNAEKQPILIIGRRRNVNISLVDLRDGTDKILLQKVAELSPLFFSYAVDYFIVSRVGLPYEKIPDFVVGRIGYDNWLVASAIKWNITVIDASNTITALHQGGSDGVKSGRTTNPGQKNMNRDLVEDFDYSGGRTECARYRTAGYNKTDAPGYRINLQLLPNNKRPKHCGR